MKSINHFLVRKGWFALVLAMAAFGSMSVAACDDDDDDDNDSSADDDTADDDLADDDDDDDDDDMIEMTYVRAIHLSPDAPNVDIYVNGSVLAFENVAFEQSTVFAELEPGAYDFDITATGTPVDDSVLSIAGLELEADTYYTAVAYDFLGSPITALAIVDDFEGVETGSIRLRAIHTASGVGDVDIWVVPDAGDPAILWENLSFGAAGDYLNLPAAEYTIGFDVDNDANPDLLFEVPALPEGTVANVFAVNDGAAVFLVAQLQDGTTALINAITK